MENNEKVDDDDGIYGLYGNVSLDQVWIYNRSFMCVIDSFVICGSCNFQDQD